jgi:hypothetical protein
MSSKDEQGTSRERAAAQPPCEQQNKDGTPCRGRVRPGSRWCFAHNPSLATRREQARREGGRARSRPAKVLPVNTEDVPCATIADVKRLLGITVNQVRRGQLEVKVGTCVGFLSGLLRKATEAGDLEQKVADLREQLAEVQRNGIGNAQTTSGKARGRANGLDRGGGAPAHGIAGESNHLS